MHHNFIFSHCQISYLNKNFLFVYSPPMGKKQLRKLERFLIGAAQLSKYISPKNANKVLLASQKMKTDKTTLKFRKYGKIEIYNK